MFGKSLTLGQTKNYDEDPVFPTSRKLGDVVFFGVDGARSTSGSRGSPIPQSPKSRRSRHIGP